MKVRILLVDSDPEETLFLQDVLAEIQEGHGWPGYVEMDCIHAPSWADAESILTSGNPTETADLILMGLDLEDAHGAEAFRQAQAIASEIPIILLIDDADTDLAIQLLREGAQDYVPLSRLECELLAHAMRTAIERQRVVNALRTALPVDLLTGLPNAVAFVNAAERERQLAGRIGCGFALVLAEMPGTPEASGTQASDLLLVNAAETLRSIAGTDHSLARIAATRFAMAVLGADEEVEAEVQRIREDAGRSQIRIGAAITVADQQAGLESLLDQASRDLNSGCGAAPTLHSKAAVMRT
ncbi:MAG: diguanylate cyclase [Bryobacteraceae bacterium]